MNYKLPIKKLINKAAGSLLIAFLVLWQNQASATIISIEASTFSPNQGDTLTIDLWVRDLGLDVVSGYDVDINFDPAILSLQSASFGSLLGGGIDSIQDAVDFGNYINFAEISFLSEFDLSSLQGGTDFILGSLSFLTEQTGTTQISIANALVTGADPFIESFSGPANTLTFDINSTQVPEPNIWLLMVFGLFVVYRQQKHSTNCQSRFGE
ncbi:hypothetical protein HII17_04880 [Thalassotalea sp. M1531]|uniref:PEP-CTERM sorting domain-containing protein n=1 Tax=Thalassotalea algicola TaxID=2716224 RepID=A0A7Y0Q676_9GAMM|nr:cohesin domain-containing protein [Thalassotalea algicola]NMP30891.1 hypothetical protein [Thalassotalea algicola]